MSGPLGYGRYSDDPKHLLCPRAKSDMSPCIARDGAVCLADDGVCVMCGVHPRAALGALMGVAVKQSMTLEAAADALQKLAHEVTEPTP